MAIGVNSRIIRNQCDEDGCECNPDMTTPDEMKGIANPTSMERHALVKDAVQGKKNTKSTKKEY